MFIMKFLRGRSSQNVAPQNAPMQDLFVVHIRLKLFLGAGKKELCATRGFYNKSERKLIVLERTEDGCCERYSVTVDESCTFVENGELPEGQPRDSLLIAATDVSSAEQLFLVLWGLSTVVPKLGKSSGSYFPKEEDLLQEAHLCVAKLQQLITGLKEPRHAEVRKTLQRVVDDDTCERSRIVATGEDGKRRICFRSIWCFDKRRQQGLILVSDEVDDGRLQTGVFGRYGNSWFDQLGLIQGTYENICVDSRRKFSRLTIWEIMTDRDSLMQHLDENHLQKFDLLIAEKLFTKLVKSEKLIDHLVCPPIEYLLAPEVRSSGEAVQASAMLAEHAWRTEYPKTYAYDRARLIAENDGLLEKLKEMEMERDRITNDNNEMRKHLSLLQQRQNISGGGDFPLEYQAISKNLNPAVDSFSNLLADSFSSITDEFDEQSCLQSLSCEVASMLNTIGMDIKAHYHSLLDKMLESLGGSETAKDASKATTLFLDGYCQRHWEHLFISEDFDNKNDQNLVVRAFHNHYGSCDRHNSLMCRMAWIRMENSGQRGEAAKFISSQLWDIFRLFWRASVTMFLQRPKLRFALHVEDEMPRCEDYSQKQHKLLDDMCKPGDPVLIIIPAVHRDADTTTETSPVLLSLARVLPVVEQGQKKKWPPVTSCDYSKSAARQNEQAQRETAGITTDNTNEDAGSQQHHCHSHGASQDNATEEHVSPSSRSGAVRTEDGANGATGKSTVCSQGDTQDRASIPGKNPDKTPHGTSAAPHQSNISRSKEGRSVPSSTPHCATTSLQPQTPNDSKMKYSAHK